jgi:hypothetical protein
MALHLASLKASPLMASASMTGRSSPHPAARASSVRVQRPEAGVVPSFRSLTAAAAAASSTAAAPAVPDEEAVLKALFPGLSTNTVSAPIAASAVPTAESVFGGNPWLDNPTGTAPGGGVYGYNQQYFATPQTAAAVAQMVGGTVMEVNGMTSAPGSPFQQQQPNEMVKLQDGALINPGLVAGFYTHGYSQSMVDQMIANEVANTKV